MRNTSPQRGQAQAALRRTATVNHVSGAVAGGPDPMSSVAETGGRRLGERSQSYPEMR